MRKIKIDNVIYEADTNFRTAIECNRIANDNTIGDFERCLGVLITMFGEKAINNPTHWEKLLKWAKNYLSCGKEVQTDDTDKDMDYIEDMEYIEASFMSDFGIDLENEDMEWQKFYKLMNGLSNSELGNCCVLNRIRNLRNFDVSQIKDKKERDKIIKAKKQVELKSTSKEYNLTMEQEESMRKLDEIIFGKE